MDVNLSKLWEIVKDGEAGTQQFLGLQRAGLKLATEQQQQILLGNPRESSSICPFYTQETWGLKRLRNFLKIM